MDTDKESDAYSQLNYVMKIPAGMMQPHFTMTVTQVMEMVRTFDQSVPLETALTAMILDKSDFIVATNEGRLSGILSAKALVKVMLTGKAALEKPISEYMTAVPNVICVTSDENLSYCMALIMQREIHHLPVVTSLDETSPDYLKVEGIFNANVISRLYFELLAGTEL